jgi:DNA-binding LacI/PurR family transcriptional regulator
MKATIYDIAKATGVSIATVSKVLNNTGRISEATRKKVLKAIEELGYEKSAIASALAGKNTYTIGFLLPDINNPFFAEVARGAEDAAFERGYSVLICSTDHREEKERSYLKTLRHKRMDGLVIATGTTPRETLEELMDEGVRIVLMSREIPGTLIGSVMVDNYHGGQLAAEHLLSLGHRKIGLIMEPLSIGSAHDIFRGFQKAAEGTDAELFVPEETGFGIEAGARLAGEMLARHEMTALFAANDELAVGVLQACRERGIRVPEDLSVVGFDNTILSRIVTPALTTVAQPIYELGRRTVHLLMDGIENEIQPKNREVLEPRLIVRESTAPPPTYR